MSRATYDVLMDCRLYGGSTVVGILGYEDTVGEFSSSAFATSSVLFQVCGAVVFMGMRVDQECALRICGLCEVVWGLDHF